MEYNEQETIKDIKISDNKMYWGLSNKGTPQYTFRTIVVLTMVSPFSIAFCKTIVHHKTVYRSVLNNVEVVKELKNNNSITSTAPIIISPLEFIPKSKSSHWLIHNCSLPVANDYPLELASIYTSLLMMPSGIVFRGIHDHGGFKVCSQTS